MSAALAYCIDEFDDEHFPCPANDNGLIDNGDNRTFTYDFLEKAGKNIRPGIAPS